ncbi:MAG TPA: hypothetical protein VF780_01115 [Nitrosospira sp.]
MKKRGVTMPITTISSREFNQDASGAKKAAGMAPYSLRIEAGRRVYCWPSMNTRSWLAGRLVVIACI